MMSKHVECEEGLLPPKPLTRGAWHSCALTIIPLFASAVLGAGFGAVLASKRSAHLSLVGQRGPAASVSAQPPFAHPAPTSGAAQPQSPLAQPMLTSGAALGRVIVDMSTVPPPDTTCAWDPHTLIGAAKRARPMGPHTAYHCSPLEGPPLMEQPRVPIRNETVERFIAEFDALFNHTRGLPTGGNPAFRCTRDCVDGDWTEHFGAAFVSVDGHVHKVGYEGHVSLMSISKVVAYMLAIQYLGVSKVQEYVSAEPSGRSYGDFATLADHRAFNPYVSTGAEIIWSLLDAATPGHYRESIELNRMAWARLSAGVGGEVRLFRDYGSQSVEEEAAASIRSLPADPKQLILNPTSTNLATIYVMAARLAQYGGLPKNASIEGTYQGFVQVNNLRLTPVMMATAAATLANGGVNPLTKDRVLSQREVRYLLTTMTMAGLYDGSGRWAFSVGMPAKSGVAGGLMVVAPGVGGFYTVSEPLDPQGNSARGLAFFHGLAHRFPYLHGDTPGAGSDPNIALTAQEACQLVTKTVQLTPGHYTPD